MNTIINQSGKEVIAVGFEGSHIRNADQFDITMPKLIIQAEAMVQLDYYSPAELISIMEADGIDGSKFADLCKTAMFYAKLNLKRI